MASPVVRPRDVYWLPIPGRNGITKTRCCLVIESFPTDHNPDVVVIVAGVSDTSSSPHVRVEPHDSSYNRLRLSNGTTFHAVDIFFYDARSPRLAQKSATCPSDLFLKLRHLLDQRIDEGDQIVLLPPEASQTAHSAAIMYISKKTE